eukprot:CAMPEP_0197866026 /NCGR_PEP_ID=MMETSP1438-20131217/43992_1 /TAXON_ID=1461541 /ORGANISM="Pterosperma sp., Strain CCMP1384" /LENGTH=67 /DNA_ID=CAMNT_0043484557 /DNA_START=535 /DNA_END=739 /DNA_ORIENTATION=+
MTTTTNPACGPPSARPNNALQKIWADGGASKITTSGMRESLKDCHVEVSNSSRSITQTNEDEDKSIV